MILLRRVYNGRTCRAFRRSCPCSPPDHAVAAPVRGSCAPAFWCHRERARERRSARGAASRTLRTRARQSGRMRRSGRMAWRRHGRRLGQPGERATARRVALADAADLDAVLPAAVDAARAWRDVPAPQARRSRAPLRRSAARAQGRARHAGLARDRQDQGRRRRRSAGDDRHRRLRGRPVAHALRQDDALRAPGAPHVRAVASARRRRHHLGVQLSGRGVGVERDARRGLRRRDGLEAVAEDAARRARRAVISPIA